MKMNRENYTQYVVEAHKLEVLEALADQLLADDTIKTILDSMDDESLTKFMNLVGDSAGRLAGICVGQALEQVGITSVEIPDESDAHSGSPL